MKTKYIYFFRGSLESHVDIYKAWVDVISDSLDVTLLTILDNKRYEKQKHKVNHYKGNGVKIIKTPRYLTKVVMFLYFSYQCLTNDKVVIHLKKQSPDLLLIIRKLFPKKIRYIIDIEGDFDAEIDYLSREENSYKNGFYKETILGMRNASKNISKQVADADGVILATQTHKDIYIERYGAKIANKLHVLPTGFDCDKFYPDAHLRKVYREKYNIDDRFVMIYSGNLFYSWQNFKRTLDLFLYLKNNFRSDLYLIILTREKDKDIAQGFLDTFEISKFDYLLKNVPFDEVNSFLNASDIGVLLRDDHLLNKIATTAKVGEYLASGLTVLTSKYIGLYSEQMEKDGQGILLENIYSNNEAVQKLKSHNFNNTRSEISNWAIKRFSVQAYRKNYIQILISISEL